MLFVAVIVAPDECFLLRIFLGINVNNVKTEIKIFRNYDLEILFKVLITVKINSVYKSA